MTVREATNADFESVVRLYRQLNPDDPVLVDGSDRATFEVIVETSNLHIFVAEIEGLIAATCYLNVIPNLTRRASPYGVIENVVTDVSFRGKGLGKAVVQQALRQAWLAGCYKVMLLTGSRKESTREFYRACGFNDDEKIAFVARPNG